MAEDEKPDDAQKTEEPTAKRLADSREKGQVALSREVNNWVMLFVSTILIAAYSKTVMHELKEMLGKYIANSDAMPQGQGAMSIVLGGAFWETMHIMALPLLILVAAAFLGPFVQIGPLFAPKAIKPDLSKISPIKGFGRLFSVRSLVEFAKGIFKLSVVSLVGFIIIYPFYKSVEQIVGLPLEMTMEQLLILFINMMTGVLIVLLIIAFVDLVFQRMQHQKQMRMTRQEVKDEYRQSEGDPHVKGRLRQLRAERARQRMMQAVPDADVVVTNPTHYSIALKYDPEKMDAPVCVAKGVDELALRIREVAKDNNVVLYENVPLARALFDTVEIDETIPMEHYKAVAEVISYVFKMRGTLH